MSIYKNLLNDYFWINVFSYVFIYLIFAFIVDFVVFYLIGFSIKIKMILCCLI